MNSYVALTIITILSLISKADNQEVTPMRIVCYRHGLDFGNTPWNLYTRNEKCTHVIVKAGDLDCKTAYVSHNMSSARAFKEAFPYLKLILHLDPVVPERSNYPQVIESNVGRSRLTSSAVSLLKDNEYDGLDVVFHYYYFSAMRQLLLDMRKEFNKHDLMLTALFPSRWDQYEKLSDIAEILDFINIKSFEEDLYPSITKLSAPLHSSNSEWSVDKLINNYLSFGVPSTKIVMGIPTYAATYQLRNADRYSIGAQTERRDYAVKEFQPLNEITGPRWVYHRDNVSQAPYASNYLLWATYDDNVSVTAKALYIIDNGLGGAMLSPYYEYDETDSELPFVTILRKTLMGD